MSSAYFIWLERRTVDKLKTARRLGEGHILRLAI
jgi:hypothetical protein